MEMDAMRAATKKKLWNMLRAIVFSMKKSLIKTKIIPFDIAKVAGKAIANLAEFHHGSAFSCQTIDIANSYISTRDYEFSCCSNTPNAHPFRFNFNKRRNRRRYFPNSYRYDDFSALAAVLDFVHVDRKPEASPLAPLPGVGKSSPFVVRQLRVTDSPFSLRDDDDDDGESQIVDKAAEEFIVKFYKDLRLERSLAAFESPYRNTLCR